MRAVPEVVPEEAFPAAAAGAAELMCTGCSYRYTVIKELVKAGMTVEQCGFLAPLLRPTLPRRTRAHDSTPPMPLLHRMLPHSIHLLAAAQWYSQTRAPRG